MIDKDKLVIGINKEIRQLVAEGSPYQAVISLEALREGINNGTFDVDTPTYSIFLLDPDSHDLVKVESNLSLVEATRTRAVKYSGRGSIQEEKK